MENHASFVWSIAESLRGPFKPAEYGSVILPFTVLARMDAVLADTKSDVLVAARELRNVPDAVREFKLQQAAKHSFYKRHRARSAAPRPRGRAGSGATGRLTASGHPRAFHS